MGPPPPPRGAQSLKFCEKGRCLRRPRPEPAAGAPPFRLPCRCAWWQRAVCSAADSGATFGRVSLLVCTEVGVQGCTAGWVCVQSGGVQERGVCPRKYRHCWSAKDFPILCCLNVCLTIVHNKWVKWLFSLTPALFFSEELAHWVLRVCALHFTGWLAAASPAALLPEAASAPLWASLPPTCALDPRRRESSRPRTRLPTHCRLPTEEDRKRGRLGLGRRVTVISPEGPLLGLLGSEPAGDHCHSKQPGLRVWAGV